MNKGRRILEIAAVLFTVGFLAYQFFASYYSAITTESAIYYEYSQGVELNGTIIRNEHTVSLSDDGTLHYIISDGERVAKGGVIAQVFTSDKASAAATRIAEIEKQLKTVEEIEGYNNVNAVDLNTVNSKIAQSLDAFLYKASTNRFDGADALQNELLTALTKKQVAIGENTDFTAIKEKLNNEKQSLVSVMGSAKANCVADYSGYFVSGSDGYESVLLTEDLSVYTPEFMAELKPQTVTDSDRIGKIVGDYEWYVAATVSLGESMFYKNGDTVKLRIEAADQTVTATVERVNFSKDKNTATIVLSCNEMSSDLATMRSGKMTIIREEYEGLRISQKSLRFVNGVTGVYVVSGLEVKFVSVEILYSNDEYAICKLNTTDEEKLRLYDEVVVKGRGLYDGKIIY